MSYDVKQYDTLVSVVLILGLLKVCLKERARQRSECDGEIRASQLYRPIRRRAGSRLTFCFRIQRQPRTQAPLEQRL